MFLYRASTDRTDRLARQTKLVQRMVRAGARIRRAAHRLGLLGRLEGDGLIGRAVNPADRREVLVGLTPAGVLLREQCQAALLRADESLRRAISARDVAGLKNVVARLGGLT
jgi:hypothetical protein